MNWTGNVRIVVLEWQKIMLPVRTVDQNLIGAGLENHQRNLRNLWQGYKLRFGGAKCHKKKNISWRYLQLSVTVQ